MNETDRSGELSPNDEHEAELFLEALEMQPGEEVPTIASRNMGMGSATVGPTKEIDLPLG